MTNHPPDAPAAARDRPRVLDLLEEPLVKRTIVSAAVLALAVGGTGIAAADKPADRPERAGSQSGFKVTGGGQIVSDASGGGAGDTVGFNAHRLGEGDAAKGQFQYVPRGASTNESAPAEKFHGVVTCLISGGEAQANEAAETDSNEEEALMPGSARFGGYLRDDPTRFFTVDVTDDGQGNGSNDMILVRITQSACADNPEDEDMAAEDLLKLGRGNVKIHNNPDGAATPAEAAAASASLLRSAL